MRDVRTAQLENLAPHLCNGDVKLRKCLEYDISKNRSTFGVWYIKPENWSKTGRLNSERESVSINEEIFDEVSSLPSTKGFISYCKEKSNREPKFLVKNRRKR